MTAVSQAPPSHQIDDLSELTALLDGRESPLSLPGLVAQWPLVQEARQSDEATVRYLEQFDRGVTVDCLNLPFSEDGRMFYNRDFTGFNFTRTRQPFMTALEQMLALEKCEQPDSLYVGSTTVESCLPGLLDDNPMPLESFHPLATLWIGNKSRIAAHYDAPDNLICVTAGQRKVTLFPPEQVENLYIGPLHFTPAGQAISLVDFANPDFEKFPKFNEALENALVITLDPGDALYIPSMWWHHIEGQKSLNMLVNFWWRRVPEYVGRSENALYHSLLTINQLPAAQKKAWQAMFAQFVFSDDENRFEHIPEHQRGPLGEMDENTFRQFKAWLANNLRQ